MQGQISERWNSAPAGSQWPKNVFTTLDLMENSQFESLRVQEFIQGTAYGKQSTDSTGRGCLLVRASKFPSNAKGFRGCCGVAQIGRKALGLGRIQLLEYAVTVQIAVIS